MPVPKLFCHSYINLALLEGEQKELRDEAQKGLFSYKQKDIVAPLSKSIWGRCVFTLTDTFKTLQRTGFSIFLLNTQIARVVYYFWYCLFSFNSFCHRADELHWFWIPSWCQVSTECPTWYTPPCHRHCTPPARHQRVQQRYQQFTPTLDFSLVCPPAISNLLNKATFPIRGSSTDGCRLYFYLHLREPQHTDQWISNRYTKPWKDMYVVSHK